MSGTLGDARLALEACSATSTCQANCWPRPASGWSAPRPGGKVDLALRGIASSAMDVSDGLLGDFGHILKKKHLA